jgi:hypothetical protein
MLFFSNENATVRNQIGMQISDIWDEKTFKNVNEQYKESN